MPGHVKVVLAKPIVLTVKSAEGEGERVISELTFRDEVVSGDYRGIKVSELGDPPMDALMTIAARLSGQTELVMNRLGNQDMWEVAKLVRGFMSAGLPTGDEA